MADFDFSTLITDRSQADVEALRALLSTALTDWTAEQLAAFNQAASRGAYNYTDLNRVTEAMTYLDGVLRGYGYETGFVPIKVHEEPEKPLLPDGYTQLEYLESSGGQYINTMLSLPKGFRSVLDFEFTPQNNSAQAIIGSHDTLPPYNRNYLTINANYASWNIGCYDSDNFGIPQPNVRYKLDFCNISGKISCVINDIDQGLSQSIATNSARSSLPIYLFAMNYNGVSQPAYIKLYKCMIYDEEESLLRNYIPCENDVGIVGLYDLVSGQFYENKGTGPFIGGPEIPEPEPVSDPYTWYESDVPTESTMAGYLANVSALREVLTLPENTAEVPADMAGLTLAEANAIEEILLVIEDYLTALASVFRRCGAAICGGPGFYFKN